MVTGASGGIGRRVATALAAAGAERIGLHFASDRQSAAATAEQLNTTWPSCRTDLFQADCGSHQDCQRLVDEAFDRLGRPDIWVHAAGVDVLTGDRAELSFDQKLRLLIDVDLVGSITVARRFVWRASQPEIASVGTPPPSLILIGWDQATAGMEGDAGQMFGPVKAAVEAFAKSLAQEVAPRIRVNSIAPGWIRTAWGSGVSGYWDRRATSQALMNRWGTPEDVAAAAVFLADPAASGFITGQTLEVNGGFNRRWASITND